MIHIDRIVGEGWATRLEAQIKRRPTGDEPVESHVSKCAKRGAPGTHKAAPNIEFFNTHR